MKIAWHNQCIYIDQADYLKKILLCFQMQNAHHAPIPLLTGYHPQKHTGPVNHVLQKKFQMLIGSLLYLMLGTYPDITFAVTQLAWHTANPSKDHLAKALYICWYLAGTQNYALVYKGDSKLGIHACTDSDWALNSEDWCSQTGYYLMIAGGVFSWTSRTQRTVMLSSTEAKYMALSDCSQQCIWVRSILTELGYKFGPIHISGDNQGSIFMASNTITESCNKHIDVWYHAIQDFVAQGKVKLFYLEGNENPTDMFTKNLGQAKFCKFRGQLGLEFY